MAAKRILVVDDEEMVRMVMRMVLVSAGFHVSEATDGEDALQQVAEPGQSFDLVLLDHQMPRMNGWETLAELRRQVPDARVVMLSGMLGNDLNQALADRAVRFLPKPFENQELIQIVREALEE